MNEHHNSNDDRRPERDQPPRLQPRIWVGSLADYNAGRLHGDWFDAAVPDEQLLAEVQAMLDASPEPIAEEYGIFDYDEFWAFKPGEYEDLRTITAVARGIAEHGPAFAIWAELHDADPAMLDHFGDAYIGHFDDPEEWARDMLADIDEQLDQTISTSLRGYVQIDYAAWLRDCDLGGDIHLEPDPDGSGVYLFRIT